MCGVIYRFLPPESHKKTITNVSGIAQVLVFLNEENEENFPWFSLLCSLGTDKYAHSHTL